MGSLHSLSRLNRGLTAAILCALASIGGLAAQSGEAETNDTVRSQLILALRPVTLTVPLGLEANTAVNRGLLRAPEGTSIRVQVGTLQAHPLMRIGTLDGSEARVEGDESARPRPRRYALWLTRTDTAWLLEAERAATGDDADGPELVGTIPLSRRDASELAPTLSAALVPTGQDTGQLLLRWGSHEWTAGFDFEEPPEDRDGQGGGGADGVRDFDSDTSAIARAVTLSERHETAMVLTGGSRVSVLAWQDISPAHADYAAVESIREGDVIRLTEAAALRLRTEVSLRFGQLDVSTDNLAPDFPGSYALWLKRGASGWRLVFNHEADAWGTQYDADFDAGEIALTHAEDGSTIRPLGAALVPTAEGSGQLVIHWGPHTWTADFDVAS